jgi:hypothetical protein
MRGTPSIDRGGASTPTQPVRCPRARELVPEQLHPLHDAVTTRARESRAAALLLTGSTARRTRTAISDLDYHLVGEPIATDDLSGELDLHVVSPALLNTRLREGDDFTHWSLRFGCVVFDEGIVSESVRFMAEQRLWPDPARKERQVRKSLGIARAMVASGDHDAAVEQVRTALSLAARWRLLADGQFPLARAELPAQLEARGYARLAIDLDATIHEAPPLHQLGLYVEAAYDLLDPPPASVERDAPDRAA